MAIRNVRLTATGLATAAALLVVALPAGYFLVSYGCGDREDRLAAALAGDPVLDAVPDGAGKREEYRSCDDDDLFVSVGESFSYGDSRAVVLGHYREAARANGWRPHTSSGGKPVPDCFTKRLDGTTAYFDVTVADGGPVELSITADHQDADSWC
ncbi:hypothetical protein [Streptomyces sp. NPDC014894]|uniref:hypothetical protein n=1 Tax=Streptomyces sp. NPDC014894 TaxID=3364931 RepID=UPI0037010922